MLDYNNNEERRLRGTWPLANVGGGGGNCLAFSQKTREGTTGPCQFTRIRIPGIGSLHPVAYCHSCTEMRGEEISK